MHYFEVADNITSLVRKLPEQSEFIYAFLEAYGTPQANVTRLKSGTMNLAKLEGDLLFKKKLYFKPTEGDLFATLDTLKSDKAMLSNDPRFLLVTDFQHLVALDRKTDDTLDCKLADLPSHFDFFLPLAGMEKTKLSNENPADIKAAERMAKLFDAIRSHNPEFVEANSHAMNVFLARLLFCFYAEDTGIFPEENAISNAIASHTAADGSDLHDFFVRLFDILDRKSRAGLPQHLQSLPYVNGGLFREHFPIPEFSMKARRMMLEAGELSWADINPDIFGSMFQAVIDPEERHNLGQHYTSVTNIMKVIEPLFLNDFREAFEKACSLRRGQSQALHRLLERIAKVKIFDPACGSGNFLIIAYKELRRLEMDIFQELQRTTGELPLSGLQVSQFYGIEIADFAAETAVLALWLTEHQMNLESKRVCGQAPDNLPLRDGANIKCANACRIDWESVCPKEDGDEIYILGNPPYLGASMQTALHKSDMAYVFTGIKGYKNLDFIACWFFKAGKFITNSNIKAAFVTTNSICQGEQVALLWPHVLKRGLEIGFAHQSFKWTNNAKGNAGVTCAIVGLRVKSNEAAILYRGGLASHVKVINPYLSTGADVIVFKRSRSISNLPPISYGSKPVDGGNLILSVEERRSLIEEYPSAASLLKKYIGSVEFIRGSVRYCLWIENQDLQQALETKPVFNRINQVREMRLASQKATTREDAERAHAFSEIRYQKSESVIIPEVSSERREYVPSGFLDKDTVISNLAYAIYDADPTIFGLLTSRMHMTWVRAVAGRLKTDYRYSAGLCYNTFPVPNLSATQKQELTTQVMQVLQERENHPEKTMAQLYDPDKMPAGLRAAHQALDLTVDRLYQKAPFTSDEERLEHLFKRYEAMIAKEQEGKK
ncbi:DNA methyltransferase [Coraliomargarita algicola]|uniref:site-specific DNA-methyltransferase (adenine-specific) n=1 Tax=Coraliomargarita algicola TaxID=3092156 RepID=A0ABZ0RS33_9BACT|nr:DNA methyltransferase [Coraliomargarita sp. J2-16]WPJ98133.1 DNA methyltransferase [Coraliomargarita sp. J2-16]